LNPLLAWFSTFPHFGHLRPSIIFVFFMPLLYHKMIVLATARAFRQFAGIYSTRTSCYAWCVKKPRNHATTRRAIL
jgi:hypothetical protein